MDDEIKDDEKEIEDDEEMDDDPLAHDLGKKKKGGIPHHEDDIAGDTDGTESLDDLAEGEEEMLPEDGFDDHDEL